MCSSPWLEMVLSWCPLDGTVYTSPAPKGTLVNSVGAGDSMVAGFHDGLPQHPGDLQQAPRSGHRSSGSASALLGEPRHPGRGPHTCLTPVRVK